VLRLLAAIRGHRAPNVNLILGETSSLVTADEPAATGLVRSGVDALALARWSLGDRGSPPEGEALRAKRNEGSG